jgi:hypothetical protein
VIFRRLFQRRTLGRAEQAGDFRAVALLEGLSSPATALV